MTEIGNKKENFKSYLNECLDTAENSIDFSPKLLNGELEVARASNVVLYLAQKIKAQSKKKDITPSKKRIGLLVITNFRLCYVPYDIDEERGFLKRNVSHQENFFVDTYDITLSNMDEIYVYTDKKHKLVVPQQKNPSKIDAIRILCKNFRMMTFDFTEKCEVGKGKYIADALLQFAFPAQHNLLFMYHFREKYYSSACNFRAFSDANDWYHEMERCGISSQKGAWRVLDRKAPCEDALPRCFVIPRHLTDKDYLDLCNSFRCKRAAVWVWSTGTASLLRMADLLPELLNNPKGNVHTNENLMLEHIRMCADVRNAAPKCIELTKILPSIQDVYQSYVRFRTLCSPISDRELMTQDEKFLTQLDKTCWLLYVSLCLKTANECAKHLQDGVSVVLQENDGRDMSCIISSIIQIILDPFCRTINGFQALIQKEWVALGHPFCDRIGHIHSKNNNERSPIFLLFLDCVWQMLQQYPGSFEFSETFLTTIWDAVFVPIFDTFQFNCEYDRLSAIHNDHLVLRPVWDWGEMFSDKDIALFTNPMYKRPQLTESEIENHRRSKLPPTALKLPGMMELPVNHPKLRYSLQPTRNIDTEAKLLRPSEIFHNTPIEIPKKSAEKPKTVNSDQNKHLKPSHFLWDLEIFSQCYYRFMPIIEIRNGGFVHIDLFNRMLLNNMHKMQRAIETRNFSDLQLDEKEDLNKSNEESLESADFALLNDSSNKNCSKPQVPVVNSFFPFSYGNSEHDNSNLNEILLFQTISEGSVLDFDT